jgi:drug/metabolite transporter (DMT)-like permease
MAARHRDRRKPGGPAMVAPVNRSFSTAMPYVLLTLTVLFWSGNFVIGRGVHDMVPPISLAFWRWSIALLLLSPVAAGPVVRQWHLIRRHWRLLCLLAFLSVTNFNTFIYLALQSNTVVNTVLINSLTPVFIVFVSWIGFSEKITALQAVGGLLSFAGLIWIITRGEPVEVFRTRFSTGDLWTLAAAVSWATYSVLLRKRPPLLNPIGFLGSIVAVGLIFLSPFYLWELSRVGGFAVDERTAAAIVYIALFASVLAYIFWNRAVAVVGANRAGIFVHLMPVFSITLAAVFLGERLRAYHAPGIALILCGIVLTSTGKRLRRKPRHADRQPATGSSGKPPGA